jgi:hypothetical protein
MNRDHRGVVKTGSVLWESGAITCICLVLAIDHIEITLTVNGVVIDREVFSDGESASQHAIEQMHAYAAR